MPFNKKFDFSTLRTLQVKRGEGLHYLFNIIWEIDSDNNLNSVQTFLTPAQAIELAKMILHEEANILLRKG